MLTPEYLDSLPEPVLKLFRQVEGDILEDMARRISKMGAVTATADWQRWRLEQLGETREFIYYHLQRLTGKTQGELNALFQEAGGTALYYDDQIYRAFGLTPGKANENPELLQLLNAGARQTQQSFQNLTRTTANTATQQFERALDRAWLQVSSGAFSYQAAIRTAIKSLASTGMQAIQYPTGHVDTLEVAVRRAVLTGVGKTTGEICLAHAEEMGCDLMEITAHPGARPSHMVWQGKIVSLSGRKGYLSKSDIGYGTGAGFKGWNCRHDWFPYFEGLSESAYPREKLREYENQTVTYNGKTLSYYDATQQQRYLERQIRRWKREYKMMDAAGQDTTQASMKLAKWRAAEKDFCKQTGLDRDGFRSQVEGFGRSEASRATWKAKTANQNTPNPLAEYQKRAQEILDQSKEKYGSGMTMSAAGGKINADDEEAIYEYMTSGVAYSLNDALRSGVTLTQKQEKIMRALDMALSKLPDYEGVVYRSLSSEFMDMDTFFAEHEVGKRVRYDAFTSTGKEVYDETMDIQLVLKIKHGKDISQWNENETEVLLRRGSSFYVTKVEGKTIFLEEI